MERLKTHIGRTFRKGDLYTQFGRNQFMIILNGTERENGVQAFQRLLKTWSSDRDARGVLTFSLESLVTLVGMEEEKKKKQISWGKNGKKWV